MRFLVILLFAMCIPSPLLVQEPTREPAVRGRVTDEGGGVLPGVTISANAPGWTATVVTNEEGEFLLVGAPPGIEGFTVTASLAGFDSVERSLRAPPAAIVLDFVLRLACLSIVDYVYYDHLPDALNAASDVLHVKVLSAVPWSRPPRCGTERATEHAVVVLGVVKAGRDIVQPGATFHLLTSSDTTRLRVGEEAILPFSWNDETQRFIAWQDHYTLRIADGRVVLNTPRAIAGVHGELVAAAVKTLRALVQR